LGRCSGRDAGKIVLGASFVAGCADRTIKVAVKGVFERAANLDY